MTDNPYIFSITDTVIKLHEVLYQKLKPWENVCTSLFYYFVSVRQDLKTLVGSSAAFK